MKRVMRRSLDRRKTDLTIPIRKMCKYAHTLMRVCLFARLCLHMPLGLFV